MSDTNFRDDDGPLPSYPLSQRVVDGYETSWWQDVNNYVYRSAVLIPASGNALIDTAAIQAAVDANRVVVLQPGQLYYVTAVTVPARGMRMIAYGARVIISGAGFVRDLGQQLRAVWLALPGNGYLDGGPYCYYTTFISGGEFSVQAGAGFYSDRVPFIAYTGLPPAPPQPGILLQAVFTVRDCMVTLEDATSIGVGVHGGWGATCDNVTFTGFDVGIAVDIGASAADGDVSCHPQLISLRGCTFNSCHPIRAVKGTCTNSCEALNIIDCKMNFVQSVDIQTCNALCWQSNYFVSNYESIQLVDSGRVMFEGSNYFQVAYPGAGVHTAVIRAQNCAGFSFDGGRFIVNNAASTRNLIEFHTNAVNDYKDISITNLRATKSVLGGSAIVFSALTAGFTFEDVFIDNVHAPFHGFIVNTFNMTGANGREFTIRNLSRTPGDGCTFWIQGLSRLDLATLNAPEYFQRVFLNIKTSANNTGAAQQVYRYELPTTVRSATAGLGISAFVNVAGSSAFTVALTGLLSVSVGLNQLAGLAVGANVEATAQLDITGVAV